MWALLYNMKKPFSTEINSLLDTLTHRLYSEKDVFIRELISNAADACSKAKFYSNTGKIIFTHGKILIKINKDNKTIIFCDNGIGMTKDQMEQNLGVIAYSDTSKVSKDNKIDVIGQFGIGFYSAFIVANKVEVWSKSYDSNSSAIWISDGKTGYEIIENKNPFVPEFFNNIQKDYENIKKEDIFYGTQIKLHLKDEDISFLNEEIIRQYVRNNLNYVNILVYINDFEEAVNLGEIIWKRPSLTITEHNEIFHELLNRKGELFTYGHFKKEGVNNNYTCLIYISEKEHLMPADRSQKSVVKIYLNGIFVCENYEILHPFRFASAIVDISDAPINLNRETIQASPIMKKIYKFLPITLLDLLLKKIKEDISNYYNKFYEHYSSMLKEALCMNNDYQLRLLDCLVFKTAEGLITLEQYKKEAQEKNNPKEILYTTHGHSSQLDFYKEHGRNVLIMNEKIDEIWPHFIRDYNEYKLVSIDTTSEIENISEEQKEILSRISEKLEKKVKTVKLCDNIRGRVASFMNDDKDPLDYRFATAMSLKAVPVLGLNIHHPVVDILLSNKLQKEDFNLIVENCYNIALFADKISNSVEDDSYQSIKNFDDSILQIAKFMSEK